MRDDTTWSKNITADVSAQYSVFEDTIISSSNSGSTSQTTSEPQITNSVWSLPINNTSTTQQDTKNNQVSTEPVSTLTQVEIKNVSQQEVKVVTALHNFEPSQQYAIKNRRSGKVVDIMRGETNNGNKLQQNQSLDTQQQQILK